MTASSGIPPGLAALPEQALYIPGLELFYTGLIGQLQVDGGYADLAVLDRGEVGAFLLVPSRGIVVDVVAHAPLRVPDLDELVGVEPAPELRHPRALELALGHVRRVDRQDAARRELLRGDPREASGETGHGPKVELPFVVVVPGALDGQR